MKVRTEYRSFESSLNQQGLEGNEYMNSRSSLVRLEVTDENGQIMPDNVTMADRLGAVNKAVDNRFPELGMSSAEMPETSKEMGEYFRTNENVLANALSETLEGQEPSVRKEHEPVPSYEL